MKVTQIIKNAIETRVKEIAEPKKQALREQLDKLHDEQIAYLTSIKTEIRNLFSASYTNIFRSICKKHPEIKLYSTEYNYPKCNYILNTPEQIAESLSKESSLGFVYYKKDEEDDLEAQTNDLDEKINKTINDIILELELGGNKATLDDLLKKVKF